MPATGRPAGGRKEVLALPAPVSLSHTPSHRTHTQRRVSSASTGRCQHVERVANYLTARLCGYSPVEDNKLVPHQRCEVLRVASVASWCVARWHQPTRTRRSTRCGA
jgi:hypothetical protein